MKVQMRRWFAIGLTSGSLAISLLAGSGAVGAAGPSVGAGGTDGTSRVGNKGYDDERDTGSVTIAAIAPDRTVTIVPAGVATPTVTQDQVFNRDART